MLPSTIYVCSYQLSQAPLLNPKSRKMRLTQINQIIQYSEDSTNTETFSWKVMKYQRFKKHTNSSNQTEWPLRASRESKGRRRTWRRLNTTSLLILAKTPLRLPAATDKRLRIFVRRNQKELTGTSSLVRTLNGKKLHRPFQNLKGTRNAASSLK